MPLGASRRRAAGLAARTLPRRSTTSTPSSISSITSRLSCACWRAISRLPRALISSRARRPRELAGEHGDDEEAAAGEARLRHQQRRVAAGGDAEPARAEQRQRRGAAVASASTRGVRTPAISTGRTSSA